MSATRPSSQQRRLWQKMSVILAFSVVTVLAECGLISTFGMSQSGLSRRQRLLARRRRARRSRAGRMCSAAISAASSTTWPRPILMNARPACMRRRRRRRSLAVSAVCGTVTHHGVGRAEQRVRRSEAGCKASNRSACARVAPRVRAHGDRYAGRRRGRAGRCRGRGRRRRSSPACGRRRSRRNSGSSDARAAPPRGAAGRANEQQRHEDELGQRPCMHAAGGGDQHVAVQQPERRAAGRRRCWSSGSSAGWSPRGVVRVGGRSHRISADVSARSSALCCAGVAREWRALVVGDVARRAAAGPVGRSTPAGRIDGADALDVIGFQRAGDEQPVGWHVLPILRRRGDHQKHEVPQARVVDRMFHTRWNMNDIVRAHHCAFTVDFHQPLTVQHMIDLLLHFMAVRRDVALWLVRGNTVVEAAGRAVRGVTSIFECAS